MPATDASWPQSPTRRPKSHPGNTITARPKDKYNARRQSDRLLAPPLIAPDNGLQVASLLDLGGTKVCVVQVRAEAKDYLDIDALLVDGRIDLPAALAAGRAIYGSQFNPQSTLKALSYFDDGNLRRLPAPVKDRLAKAARDVDLDRLPLIAAPVRGANPDWGGAR